MPQRRLRVRLLGVAAACVLMLAALELASAVLFYAATGRRFSYEGIAREQAAQVEASSPPVITGAVTPGPEADPGPARQSKAARR